MPKKRDREFAENHCAAVILMEINEMSPFRRKRHKARHITPA
jgi:hypothetical protein